jgi:Ca2+-binding EF-hand superfamily protein
MKMKRLHTVAFAGVLAATVFATAQAAPEQGASTNGAQGPGNGVGGGFGNIANRIIERLDSDDDGQISLDEFLARPLNRADARFDRLDENDDGLVSLEEIQTTPPGGGGEHDAAELRACVEDKLGEELPVRPTPEERFAQTDTNGDGFVDLDEFITAVANRATTRFNANDTNGDGYVDHDELVHVLQERGAVRQAVRECRTELAALDEVTGE